ncbi:hydroxyphenylacetyl-CoA thioesterase PaaI [Oricola cellulosilytica]|uniref:Hydroxyphenylacetyl-CoA thioesterase PaaI n=1 Tax=Oricola cellulosilytica TaxID=1429082 RepID=A0A4R0PCE7_9HYPH|nr:hydroxyphenylacetyl-CoA thioesterase PaaI [Oricola cellulosilytica]TCD14956.1 hydroxyphenylacetyl-CoA thioesterase PaaI [Oricola cellulosilytica]
MAASDQERAERSTAAMWASDNASKWFGMTIESVGKGTATLTLTVEKHHTNGHDNCHGGVIFALADSAFAFACNSGNEATVAQSNSITYVAPARSGDRLTATAVEIVRRGRSGTYDVTVRREDGTVIALFRGLARAVGGTLYDEASQQDGETAS